MRVCVCRYLHTGMCRLTVCCLTIQQSGFFISKTKRKKKKRQEENERAKKKRVREEFFLLLMKSPNGCQAFVFFVVFFLVCTKQKFKIHTLTTPRD